MTVPKNCPLCHTNGKVKMMAETPDAYLAKPTVAAVEGCYLIVPKPHLTDVMMLPGRWHVSLRNLLGQVPWYRLGTSFNLSFNSGEAAGQTLPHIHFWVIPRMEDESTPSYKKGTATLISMLNDTTSTAT